MPDGSYMYARDATSRRDIQKSIIANVQLSNYADRVRALTDTVGKREPSSAEIAAAGTLVSQMKFTYKNSEGAGSIDQGLLNEMDNFIGNPTSLFRVKDAARKLEEVGRISQQKIRDLATYELHPDATFGPSVPVRPPGESDE